MISLLVKILMVIFVIILIVILALFLFLVWRTSKIQQDPRQGIFLGGTLPSPNPDGFYTGTATRYKKSWLGKKFNSVTSTGINIFNNKEGIQIERYSFITYAGKGLADKNLDVLKIDYNVKDNQFWLRFLVDEIVQVKPNYYLGKMHLKIIPGFPFSILYFDLKK